MLTEIRQSPADKAYEQALVDDGRIYEWLKAAYTFLANRETKRKSLDTGGKASLFCGMFEAVFHRTPNWTLLWKEETDYRRIAEELKPALLLEFSKNADLTMAALRAEPGTLFVAQLEMFQRACHKIVLAYEEDAQEGMNKVAALLLYDDNPTKSFAKAKRLGSILFSLASGGSLSTEGHWTCSYERFSALADGPEATHLYEESSRVTAMSVSPLVAALVVVERKRPKFFVSFLDPTNRRMRSGSTTPFGEDVKTAFCRAFPTAVGTILQYELDSALGNYKREV